MKLNINLIFFISKNIHNNFVKIYNEILLKNKGNKKNLFNTLKISIKEKIKKELKEKIENKKIFEETFDKLYNTIFKKFEKIIKVKKDTQKLNLKNIKTFKSVIYPVSCIKILNENNLNIENIGKFKIREKININEKIIMFQFKILNKGFEVILTINREIKKYEKTNKIIGIDLGLRKFLVGSNKEIIKKPNYMEEYENKIIPLQQEISKIREDNPKNWKEDIQREKKKKELGRIFEKIINKREDFIKKVIHYLLKNYDIVVIEKLKIQKMMVSKSMEKTQRKINNKKWVDNSFYKFTEKLKTKAKMVGKEIKEVEPHYTSKTCYNCNSIKSNLGKNEIFECEKCNYKEDRDYNAALNILNKIK
jgi:putative transposase